MVPRRALALSRTYPALLSILPNEEGRDPEARVSHEHIAREVLAHRFLGRAESP